MMDVTKSILVSGRVWVGVVLGVVVLLSGHTQFAAKEAPNRDPMKVMGPKECGECHKSEVHTWLGTKHYLTFKELPRKKEAKEIAEKMGIRRMKKDSTCLNCHFTMGIKRNKPRAIAGISCESCHGPAKEWIKVHGDFGGKDVTREQETPEHKKERLGKMKAAGMIRPSMLYSLAQNCFQCHTVPNEKLVNVGGHKPGSEFELVSWSQGENRHNFLASEGKKNEPATPERTRMLYAVGRLLDLEYSLRALAKAKENGKYADAMAKRVKAAMDKVKELNALVNVAELEQAVAAAGAVELKPNNQAAVAGAADKVAAAAQEFADSHDGSKLAAADKVIPKPDKYKGKPGGPAPGV